MRREVELVSLTSSASERFEDLKSQQHSAKMAVVLEQGRLMSLEEDRDRVVSELSDINTKMDNFKLIEAYLAQFADERQETVFRQIEATVTEGLRSVFEEDLRLEVGTKMVGSRAETVFNIVSTADGEELTTSIMDSRGGGVAAIVGFLVQAVIVLLTPNMRPILFLDETFRAVSEHYQAPLGEFIQDLCSRTGLQVVLVSHQPTISDYADKAYAFSQVNGRTKIKKVL